MITRSEHIVAHRAQSRPGRFEYPRAARNQPLAGMARVLLKDLVSSSQQPETINQKPASVIG
jgi:hypothetical protein